MASLPGYTLVPKTANPAGVQLIPPGEIPDEGGDLKTQYLVTVRDEHNGERIYFGRPGLGSGGTNKYAQIAFSIRDVDSVNYPDYLTREQLPNLYAYCDSSTMVYIDISRRDG